MIPRSVSKLRFQRQHCFHWLCSLLCPISRASFPHLTPLRDLRTFQLFAVYSGSAEIGSGLPQLQSDNFLKALSSCQMQTGYHIPGQYVGFSSICFHSSLYSVTEHFSFSSCFIPQLFDRLSHWMHLF